MGTSEKCVWNSNVIGCSSESTAWAPVSLVRPLGTVHTPSSKNGHDATFRELYGKCRRPLQPILRWERVAATRFPLPQRAGCTFRARTPFSPHTTRDVCVQSHVFRSLCFFKRNFGSLHFSTKQVQKTLESCAVDHHLNESQKQTPKKGSTNTSGSFVSAPDQLKNGSAYPNNHCPRTQLECKWNSWVWGKLLNVKGTITACGNILCLQNFVENTKTVLRHWKTEKKWLSWVSWKCISLREFWSEKSDKNQIKIRAKDQIKIR